MKGPVFNVLMVEDDEHDIAAIRRCWEKHDIQNNLSIVTSAEQCLDYLYARGEYKDVSKCMLPDVLILDVQLPGIDGLDLLKQLREEQRFAHLPVIIFSTSSLEEERKRSDEYGANAYIVKPLGFQDYSEALQIINNYWNLVLRKGVSS